MGRGTAELEQDWRTSERWAGILRPYGAEDVDRLRGSVRIRHTLAELGAERLWDLLRTEDYVQALGALTGNQAIQQVRAGLRAIYLSGWQVAADGNDAGQMYPDLSLYPADSVPNVVRRINNALRREDEKQHMAGKGDTRWFALIVARTDANSARLVTSDADSRDRALLTGERTAEGFFRMEGGLSAAIARGLAYAPYADMLWCETSGPDLEEARAFADAIHARFPGKILAYNCSSSFNWRKKLGPSAIATFQSELARMGYRFQFVTLAGFHTLNLSMFGLAQDYKDRGMSAYAELQDKEFAARAKGYRAVEHQAFVGTEYFDEVGQVISGGTSSTLAMEGSTEREQVTAAPPTKRVSSSST